MEPRVDLEKRGEWQPPSAAVEGEVRASAPGGSGRRSEETGPVAPGTGQRTGAGARAAAGRARQVGRRTVIVRTGTGTAGWTSPDAAGPAGVPRQPGPAGPPPAIGTPPSGGPHHAPPPPGASTRLPTHRPGPAASTGGPATLPTGPAPFSGMPGSRQVTIPRPTFLSRYWPRPETPAGGAALAATVAVGLTAGGALTVSRPGLGWLLLGLVSAAGITFVLRAEGVRLSRRRILWGLAAIGLLAVGAVRSAGWLFALCVPVAVACGGLALAGGRTTRGLFAGACAIPFAALRSVFWWVAGFERIRRREDGSRPVRLLAAAGVGIALLVVFGGLFASADPTFAKILEKALPDIDGGGLVGSVLRAVSFGWGAIGAVYLATRPPTFDRVAEGGGTPVRRLEWLVPIILLDLLFAAFVAVQFGSWFGGDRYVRETAGLTYAEYARSGFWQLTVVTILTLGVLAVAARKAPRCDGGDRAAMRIGLGLLAGLALVVVASALLRMAAYEDAYGLTRLRLLVAACEAWFGLTFLMVLANGLRRPPLGRRKGGWLQTAAFGTGVGMLLLLAALNPDRVIADRNIDRYEATGRIDVYYLGELSVDAVPVIDRLPEPLRTCALLQLRRQVGLGDDAWYEFNRGRQIARTYELTDRVVCT